jgi:6-phosphogluconate dehydrogenase
VLRPLYPCGVVWWVAGLTNDELSAVFADWNSSELESYLIEVRAPHE